MNEIIEVKNMSRRHPLGGGFLVFFGCDEFVVPGGVALFLEGSPWGC